MRLTADVILRAHVCINPLRERELSLRGYKAPAIENLGVTKDGFDCIDFSDNEIKKLENFPRLRRLRMLLLHNNHISKIQENLADSIPNLEYLILTGNRFTQLAEIDHLVCLQKLDTLSLYGNPVTKRKYYREYVIHKLPQLRVLDFQKIKPHDRRAAEVLFNSLAGQKVEQEAHLEAGMSTDSGVVASAQAMQKISIASAIPPPANSILPPTAAAPPSASPTKQQASAQEQFSSPPSKSKEKNEQDIEMEDSNTVPSIPLETIDHMTVTTLREELKKRGLSIKGLKADLVQRLKEAMG